jgi:hypothetical protein
MSGKVGPVFIIPVDHVSGNFFDRAGLPESYQDREGYTVSLYYRIPKSGNVLWTELIDDDDDFSATLLHVSIEEFYGQINSQKWKKKFLINLL